jgi:FkbM family methyltransferase
MKFYAQHGEDSFVWSLFKDDKVPGFFVEVGALDGVRFSNTYAFEKIGWKGICVEAHPDYTHYLSMNRPRSHIVKAAAGKTDAFKVAFYTNKRGALSTLDPMMEDEFKAYGKYFTGFQKIEVPMFKLDTILNEYNKSQHRPVETIDVLSIDVEGTEHDVIDGLNWLKYMPRVAIIEISNSNREKIEERMERNGYMLARVLGSNGIFCRERDDVKILTNAVPASDLIHVPHILDREESK